MKTHTRGWPIGIAVGLMGASLLAGPAFAGAPNAGQLDVPLIPREVLFGNPERASPRLSPDGRQLAFLSPVNGVLNVWVGPRDKPQEAQPVTRDTLRGIRSYFWAHNNHQIIYLQDRGGNEDWHVYAVDLTAKTTTDLTPLENVRAEIEAVSDRFPDEIVVGLNDRNPEVFDLYKLDLKTRKRQLLLKNTEHFSSFVIDGDYRVRFATKMTSDGGNVVLQADPQGAWQEFMTIRPEDALTTASIGLDRAGSTLYLLDSRDRDTAALASYDLSTGKEHVIAGNSRADAGEVLMAPRERTPLAVAFDHKRVTWEVVDPAVQEDFEFLRGVTRGQLAITSQSLDNRRWIVAYLVDDGPVRFYDYDRDRKEAHFLFVSRKQLEGLPLVRMTPLVIKSRDGLDLVSYLSLPPGREVKGQLAPKEPVPMVLNVHGGPWARDRWGFNPEHQLWANRGYAVLSVNFRGSTGFGKAFVNAGNLEWGGKMQADLVDAVHWAIRQKIADPARVAITGGSYGGYATLEGMVQDPQLFACGIDIVGPSNLLTLIATIPPYWKPEIELFRTRMGDFQTKAGRQFLKERSPLTRAHRIERPLLIAQGANDPRVKQAESDQIVEALRKNNVPVTYVLFPDEGHGFARPPNRMAFYAVAEQFLEKYLHGRAQPIGNAFADSSITVPKGAGQVPGLEHALEKTTARQPSAAPR